MGKIAGRLALAVLFFSTCLVLSLPAVGAQVHGVLTVVKGKVMVKSGKTGSDKRAKAGMKVYPKDTITTAADSRAKIVMIDKNEINVSPESHVVIENYEFDPEKGKKNVLIDVLYGKVRSKVEQKYDGEGNKFQVKTPSAVAGVRGTDFFTSFNKTTKSSKVVTFRGEVAFGLPGPNGTILNPVSVRVGQFTVSMGSAPPAQPAQLPQHELANFDQETNVVEPPKNDPRAPANDPAGRGGDDGAGPDQQGGPDQGKRDERKGPRGEPGEKGPDHQAGTDPNPDKGRDGDRRGGPDDKGRRGPGPGPGDQASGGPGMPGPGMSGPGGPEMGRDPAGMPMMGPEGGGMFLPDDFANCNDCSIIAAPQLPKFEPPPLPPPLPGTGDIRCEFCNEHIQDGQTRLIIRVRNGTP